MGSQLPPREKERLIGILRKNVDMFAWDAYDAPGIYTNFICHHLNVNSLAITKKQLPRQPSKEHADAIRDEVRKLKQAGAIKEVFYPEWLANTVVVKKKSREASFCGLHRFKQGVSKRPVSHTSNRPISGRNCMTSSDELLRCLSRLSSNTTSPE